MPSKPHKAVVCNTTLLSNFAAAKHIRLLLEALGHPCYTTSEVITEISAGVQAGYTHLNELESLLLSDASPCEILALTAAELTTYRQLSLHLHAGEASCLAIAAKRNLTLGTDDLAARKNARAQEVQVIGTVGALVLCKNGLLTLAHANEILAQMIQLGYRAPVPRLDEFWN